MKAYEINTAQRVNRCLFGAALILFTMTVPVAPLGWIAVLPLIATLPIFAGMFGFDPVSKTISHEVDLVCRAVEQHYSSRHGHHRH